MDTPPWGGGVPSGISGIKRIYTKFSGIKPYVEGYTHTAKYPCVVFLKALRCICLRVCKDLPLRSLVCILASHDVSQLNLSYYRFGYVR